jgi:hypothetical protein
MLLTGSAFHQKNRKILPATWVILTLAVTAHLHLYLKLAHARSGTQRTIAAAEVTGVRGSNSRGTRIPQGTCLQNSRIILGKYLNVKLITYVV